MNINPKHLAYLKSKTYTVAIIDGLILVGLALVANFYAGRFATFKAGNSVNDIVLSNIPVYDVHNIFIYGPIVMWAVLFVYCFNKPHQIPFILKSIALFILIRSTFVSLTHIGPFPDRLIIGLDSANWMQLFTFGGDLFFSAHTGLPFLLCLIFWKEKVLRILFFATSIFFGAIVLMGHLHYSIDVLSAFFITYTIYHMSKFLFKNDFAMFELK
jgi:hypothetical protein